MKAFCFHRFLSNEVRLGGSKMLSAFSQMAIRNCVVSIYELVLLHVSAIGRLIFHRNVSEAAFSQLCMITCC